MVARAVVALVLVSVFSVLAIGGAVAQPLCADDVKKLCADVAPGGGRVQTCLREHEAQLSKECRARLDDLTKEAGLVGASCRWDIARLCSDVVPGGARVITCLEAHKDDLAPVCKSELSKASK
jgi:Golgi apparatus protein 1